MLPKELPTFVDGLDLAATSLGTCGTFALICAIFGFGLKLLGQHPKDQFGLAPLFSKILRLLAGVLLLAGLVISTIQMIATVWVPVLWANAGGYDGQVTAWVTILLYAIFWRGLPRISARLIRAIREG